MPMAIDAHIDMKIEALTERLERVPAENVRPPHPRRRATTLGARSTHR
jgi:hypothetical protein